ncbi:nitrate reductase molybdenum cofactor assembly chaperone [Microbulbifer sp. OS29]|uniref:Nitrate reductase molybdenum cofactor assembly chaperone n=1 Tax=Microbulbifer okhotskensis TaxID=2926617 RepID=A0A9X2ETW7_9GAMM|nr:nitrate reductase molybdenum cofactor assembly chaperone [Microbulbifer okhotskensis]MCO1335783.1 nitrate reductase molybdenum cofactor assembly chaperone [Microbulbifer okhotskensis]
MKRILRALALLLDYPSESLKAHIAEIRETLESEKLLSSTDRAMLEPLLRSFLQQDLLGLQVTYSDVFDNSRTLSLHFFEHIHGESRERGQAMLDLGEEYIAHGCFLQRDELPDFIPIFLEFASCLPEAEIRDWLSRPAHVFAALAKRLDERKSAYAGIFHLLIRLAGQQPDAQAVQELLARNQQAAEASVDEEWEEKPVTFMTPEHKVTERGIIARLKAAGKLILSSSDT